jgi:hypothetical protein
VAFLALMVAFTAWLINSPTSVAAQDLLQVQAPEQPIANRTLADVILIARRDYDRDAGNTATLWFRDGSNQVLGNLSEIGADFVCMLTVTGAPVATDERQPPNQTETCVPTSEIIRVTFDRRIGR